MSIVLEDFPEDVQKEILKEIGIYGVSKKHYELMKYYRELRCKAPITNYEIMRAINDHEDINVILRLYYNGYMFDVMFSIDDERNNKYKKLGSFRYWYIINSASESGIEGYVVTINPYYTGKDKTRYDYNEIYLTIGSLRILLRRRGELCERHSRDYIKNYILNTYNEVNNDVNLIGLSLLKAYALELDINNEVLNSMSKSEILSLILDSI